MATIPPHTRLKDVENAANLMALVQDNFEVLAGETAKRDPTYQNGIPTTVIGPPTTGDHVIDEFWRDALGGEWVCTVAGIPGTWKQIRPAAVTVDPASGTIPTGYFDLECHRRVVETTFWRVCVGNWDWGGCLRQSGISWRYTDWSALKLQIYSFCLQDCQGAR